MWITSFVSWHTLKIFGGVSSLSNVLKLYHKVESRLLRLWAERGMSDLCIVGNLTPTLEVKLFFETVIHCAIMKSNKDLFGFVCRGK